MEESATIWQQALDEAFAGLGTVSGAEMMAKKYELSKDALDAYSLESHKRAIAATESGQFTDEILPVAVRLADGAQTDEMHASELQLVVPRSIQRSYGPVQRDWLLSLADFVASARGKQADA